MNRNILVSNTIDEINFKLKGILVHPSITDSKLIQVDIPQGSEQARLLLARKISKIFPNSTIGEVRGKPSDVLLPNGLTVTIKSIRGGSKGSSNIFYGFLSRVNLEDFDTSAFRGVSYNFHRKKLPGIIKEKSDVACVSALNRKIVDNSNESMEGIALKFGKHTFQNVVGCLPIGPHEPKADVVLVCRGKNNTLYPDGFLSYKAGYNARAFPRYSGITKASSPRIFSNPETEHFCLVVKRLTEQKLTTEIFKEVESEAIIHDALYGMESKNQNKFGVDNCHGVCQGDPSISGSRLTFSHMFVNGDKPHFSREYEPVFGCQYEPSRSSIIPSGERIQGFRISIHPRAFRASWLQNN